MSIEEQARATAAGLAIWRGRVAPQPITGGITNLNFLVEDEGERFVVRIAGDFPIHQIMRFNEQAASRAGWLAGVSPEVVHAAPGVLVTRFIEGRTCQPGDIREPARLARLVPLLKRVHHDMPCHLRGPLLTFWVFHAIRDYAHTLAGEGSPYAARLPGFLDRAAQYERAVGPIDMVFAHNDLLAANLIDDGERLWLIDWDYGGYGSPLFDLANLASNNELETEAEEWLLSAYFGEAPDSRRWAAYEAMKCASLLREAMWSMVSEIHSRLAFDYAAYTAGYLDRYARADARFDSRRAAA